MRASRLLRVVTAVALSLSQGPLPLGARETSLVDTASTSSTTPLSAEQLSQLPSARNMEDVLRLTPGMADTKASPRDSFNWNQVPLQISAEAVNNIEVLREGGSAVYGSDALAGVANFLTKREYAYLDELQGSREWPAEMAGLGGMLVATGRAGKDNTAVFYTPSGLPFASLTERDLRRDPKFLQEVANHGCLLSMGHFITSVKDFYAADAEGEIDDEMLGWGKMSLMRKDMRRHLSQFSGAGDAAAPSVATPHYALDLLPSGYKLPKLSWDLQNRYSYADTATPKEAEGEGWWPRLPLNFKDKAGGGMTQIDPPATPAAPQESVLEDIEEPKNGPTHEPPKGPVTVEPGPGGSSVRRWQDGTIEITRPDGTQHIQYADGEQFNRHADGTTTIVKTDGTRITRGSDGKVLKTEQGARPHDVGPEDTERATPAQMLYESMERAKDKKERKEARHGVRKSAAGKGQAKPGAKKPGRLAADPPRRIASGSTRDADGNTVTIEKYDDGTTTRTVTNPAGQVLERGALSPPEPTEVPPHQPGATSASTTENGYTTAITRTPEGAVTRTITDASGNVIEQGPLAPPPPTKVPPKDTTTFVSTTNADGTTTKVERRGDGTSVRTVTDANGKMLSQENIPPPAPTKVPPRKPGTSGSTRNPDGTTTTITKNPDGTTTRTVTDAAGQIVEKSQLQKPEPTKVPPRDRTTRASTTDAQGNTTTIERKPDGTVTRTVTDRQGNITEQGPVKPEEPTRVPKREPVTEASATNEAGQTVTLKKEKDGSVTRTVTDAQGNVVERGTLTAEPVTQVPPRDRTTRASTTDADGVTTMVEKQADGSTVRTVTDPHGHVLERVTVRPAPQGPASPPLRQPHPVHGGQPAAQLIQQQLPHSAPSLVAVDAATGSATSLDLTDLFAPRIGMIYDWTKEGRSKGYAHWGRFYESLPLDLNNRSFGGEVVYESWWDWYGAPANGDAVSADPLVPAAGATPQQPTDAGALPPYGDTLIGGGSPNYGIPAGVTLVLPGIQPQYLDDFVVGAEHEVLEDLRVGLSGQYRRLGEVIEDMSTDGATTYFLGNPSALPQTQTPPGSATYHSYYVNDRWQLNDKWSFNLGVRYEPEKPKITNDPSAALGGPIIKDRLWIWGSYGTSPVPVPADPPKDDFQPYVESGVRIGDMIYSNLGTYKVGEHPILDRPQPTPGSMGTSQPNNYLGGLGLGGKPYITPSFTLPQGFTPEGVLVMPLGCTPRDKEGLLDHIEDMFGGLYEIGPDIYITEEIFRLVIQGPAVTPNDPLYDVGQEARDKAETARKAEERRRQAKGPDMSMAAPPEAGMSDIAIRGPAQQKKAGPKALDQWGLRAVGFTPTTTPGSAWALEAGEQPNVTVAIVDSGLDLTHPDGPAHLWTNAREQTGNGVDDDHNGYVDDVHGWNFVDENADLTDRQGHGTLVAGIIAAKRGNGLGVAGINPGARLMVLKVADAQGHAHSLNVYRALHYAADHGARVINMSLGERGVSRLVQLGINYAHARGAVVVVAAGNQASDLALYTGAARRALPVAALEMAGARSTLSNAGVNLGLTAPGQEIYSLHSKDAEWPGSPMDRERLYRPATGTSFAAPIVAATASLLLARQPRLPNVLVEDLLLHSATLLEREGWNTATGWGLLNAAKALTTDPKSVVTIWPSEVVVRREKKHVSQVDLFGTVRGFFTEYAVELGKGKQPSSWQRVAGPLERPVEQGLLARIDGAVLKGDKHWTLRISAKNAQGQVRVAEVPLTL